MSEVRILLIYVFIQQSFWKLNKAEHVKVCLGLNSLR